MKYSKFAWGIIALAAGLGLGACGGGGGSTSTAGNTTVGVISGFGSIYVNGCEYETDSASIYVEGTSGSEDDLSVGDVVEITGPANCTNASASSIKSSDELEGWVDSVALDANGIGTMVVMGQTVTTNNMTTFEDDSGSVTAITMATIAPNNVVEIHGYTSDQGTVLATRVEVKAASLTGYLGELELKGVIQNLNVSPDTFDIGTLNINYTSLSPSFTLADDLFVEVKFDNSKTPISIEIEDDGMLGYQGDDDEEVEIYGMLSTALVNNEFMVGDLKIQVNDTTEFEEADNGQPSLQSIISDGTNIGNVYLEVEGHFANGVLIAESVEFEDDTSDNNECKGTVSNLSPVPGEMNQGTLTVIPASPADCEGQTSMDAIVDNSTMMEDDSIANVSKFNLTNLSDGDMVEVHVDPSTGIAIKLERK